MLENAKIDALEFNYAEEQDRITMIWKGKSVMRDPRKSLTEYLDHMLEQVKKKKFVIDFRKLEYMNSGTVQPIVWLLKKLNDRNIATMVIYDKNINWQSLSFQALMLVSDILKNVTIEGLAE
jgi:hypothetical protein